jgi:serine/threonine protein kinase/Flp pilus assembly protein TadD
MVPDPSRVKSLFLQAVDDGAMEFNGDLTQACGGDEELRRQVELLLDAHRRAGDFLSDSAIATLAPPALRRADAKIGPYQLLEQIGEGGFGVVYLAEQIAPVRRRVALKVIKPGMDTRQVIARFEAERQALAVMDHPNIAHVLDAGETASGRPYCVMELVRGVPITTYCDEYQVPIRQRLELFAAVCHAIQHAHTKGIIHRDIKPTNVLVTHVDGQPVVKVIDFGIAKATGQQLTQWTLVTGTAQIVGTPLYMSPEQAESGRVDVDTRSDIYSLGVLLYELLTGSTPVRDEQLNTSLDGVRRIIREQETQRPSTRVKRAPTLPGIALARQVDPTRLSRLLQGELDWIVMKALEKDRDRRYGTASAFAADVERFLNQETVLACPPSTRYRLGKWVRRNRGTFTAAMAASFVLLLAAAALIASNVLIRQEQARTRNEKGRAQRAQQIANDHADKLRQDLDRLLAANALLEQGRWYGQTQRWDDAHAAFTKAVELRPDHAAAWVERGDMLALLGLWDLASEDFAREFALREPGTTMRWYRHALLRLSLGDADEYRAVRQRMRVRFEGTQDRRFAMEVVRTCSLEAGPQDQHEPLVELAQRTAEGDRNSWYGLYLLGMAQYRAGRNEDAVSTLRDSLTGSPEWECRSLSHPVLAMAHHRLGQVSEARQSLQAAADAIDRWTRARYAADPKHWSVHQGATAIWPVAWWDWLECELLYREAKLLIDGEPPADDPRLRVLRARAFAGLRRQFTSEREYAAVLQIWPDDLQIQLEVHRCAGYAAIGRKDWPQVAAAFSRAADLAPQDADLQYFAAVAMLHAGDLDGFRKSCAGMLDRFENTADPAVAAQVVAACVLRRDALADVDRLLPLANNAAPQYDSPSLLGAALYRSGQYEASIQCFQSSARTYRPRAWDWCFLAMAHHRLGRTGEAVRCFATACRWIEEANTLKAKDLSETAPEWGGWYDPITSGLLLREAEELLASDMKTKSREQ